MGLSLPGAVERAAEEISRTTNLGRTGAQLHRIFAKPRPGRQLAQRTSDPVLHVARAFSRDDNLAPIGARNAAVVHGSGVRQLEAVFVFRRSPGRAGEIDPRGARGEPAPVPLFAFARDETVF